MIRTIPIAAAKLRISPEFMIYTWVIRVNIVSVMFTVGKNRVKYCFERHSGENLASEGSGDGTIVALRSAVGTLECRIMVYMLYLPDIISFIRKKIVI